MLELRPDCECCGRDLPPDSPDARICSFECTFCVTCVAAFVTGNCPNCGGNLTSRPIRPKAWRQKLPTSTQHFQSEKRGGETADLDVARLAPEVITVLAEDERVRVLKLTAKSGDKLPRHRHPYTVIHVLKSGAMRFTNDAGEVSQSYLKAGEVILQGAITHSQEVLDSIDAILIEIKT